MAAAPGYAAEMRRIDEEIAKTKGALCSTPADPERITRHIYRLYQKASISGDPAGLTACERDGEAQLHYQRADTAYPGYWLVDEHVAELLGAEARYDEAVAMYQSIASNGQRPELEQAIGELCDLAGQSGPAAYWKERAL